MQEHYDRLGISPGATPAEIKAAYHGRLKEFPAHTHPQEFKAIRAAYEALKKAPKAQTFDDLFEIKPLDVKLDEALLTQLKAQATATVNVTLKDLLLLTF